jgi:hypothetical protein
MAAAKLHNNPIVSLAMEGKAATDAAKTSLAMLV